MQEFLSGSWRRPRLLSCLFGGCRPLGRPLHRQRGRSRLLLLSRLFQPVNLREDGEAEAGRPSEATCGSQRLMVQGGLVHPASPGCFYYLPSAVRALDKLVRVIDEEMESIGCQKVNAPSLSPAELWKASGRWGLMGKELFRLRDRHGADYCLSPTHEEAVTQLVASHGNLSYKQLPVMLYQVTRKFRDEPKPRFGLLRGREFHMKDLYTFDVSEEASRETYGRVCEAYGRLFGRLGLPYVKVEADAGSIGGKMSHEFQIPAAVGEDRLVVCEACRFAANVETVESGGGGGDCPRCSGKLTETRGIEVGHTFYLGTKYSGVFKATYRDAENKPVTAEMGCFGLGVTRILAAGVEVLSTADGIRWPGLLAPYQVCIVPPKRGSREAAAEGLAEGLYRALVAAAPQLGGEVVLDDRTQLTVGKRLKDAKRLGYPYVVIAGKRVLEDPAVFEVCRQKAGDTVFLTRAGVVDLLRGVETV